MSELSLKLEALLFTSSSPLTERELKEYFHVPTGELREAIHELRTTYESEQHGIFLSQLADGWIFQTKPELYDSVRVFYEAKGIRKIHLSNAAIETAAIIAYNQPVTRSEIESIRGVRSDSITVKLLEQGLIQTAGRKQAPGQPLMFRTTKKFLEVFGLSSIDELPPVEDVPYDEPEVHQHEIKINYEPEESQTKETEINHET